MVSSSGASSSTTTSYAYYTSAVFRLYPQIPPVWIDA
jgi:hypothetical protein